VVGILLISLTHLQGRRLQYHGDSDKLREK